MTLTNNLIFMRLPYPFTIGDWDKTQSFIEPTCGVIGPDIQADSREVMGSRLQEFLEQLGANTLPPAVRNHRQHQFWNVVAHIPVALVWPSP
jgi:hypothetical protein